jgi:hypothetical protein
MNVVKSSLSFSLVVAGAVLASVSAQAAPVCGSVSPVERRIVDHANGDVDSLRAFVWQTAIVHRVDMIDVRQNLDKWRSAIDCRNQAAAAAAASVTASADAPAAAEPTAFVSQR